MKLASCHPFAAYKFELVPRFFGNLCTSVLHILQLGITQRSGLRRITSTETAAGTKLQMLRLSILYSKCQYLARRAVVQNVYKV
jgi:hypothetical protein